MFQISSITRSLNVANELLPYYAFLKDPLYQFYIHIIYKYKYSNGSASFVLLFSILICKLRNHQVNNVSLSSFFSLL